MSMSSQSGDDIRQHVVALEALRIACSKAVGLPTYAIVRPKTSDHIATTLGPVRADHFGPIIQQRSPGSDASYTGASRRMSAETSLEILCAVASRWPSICRNEEKRWRPLVCVSS